MALQEKLKPGNKEIAVYRVSPMKQFRQFARLYKRVIHPSSHSHLRSGPSARAIYASSSLMGR